MFDLRIECLELDLWYQATSCLCRERNVRSWFYGTTLNHDCATDKMLKGKFVLPSYIIFLPWWNVRSWFYSTKSYHVCAIDKILEVGLVVQSQIIFVSWTEC